MKPASFSRTFEPKSRSATVCAPDFRAAVAALRWKFDIRNEFVFLKTELERIQQSAEDIGERLTEKDLQDARIAICDVLNKYPELSINCTNALTAIANIKVEFLPSENVAQGVRLQESAAYPQDKYASASAMRSVAPSRPKLGSPALYVGKPGFAYSAPPPAIPADARPDLRTIKPKSRSTDLPPPDLRDAVATLHNEVVGEKDFVDLNIALLGILQSADTIRRPMTDSELERAETDICVASARDERLIEIGADALAAIGKIREAKARHSDAPSLPQQEPPALYVAKPGFAYSAPPPAITAEGELPEMSGPETNIYKFKANLVTFIERCEKIVQTCNTRMNEYTRDSEKLMEIPIVLIRNVQEPGIWKNSTAAQKLGKIAKLAVRRATAERHAAVAIGDMGKRYTELVAVIKNSDVYKKPPLEATLASVESLEKEVDKALDIASDARAFANEASKIVVMRKKELLSVL